VEKLQGGAPNNFLILTKNNDPSIRKVETKISPRIPDAEHRTPMTIGPGAYNKTKSETVNNMMKM